MEASAAHIVLFFTNVSLLYILVFIEFNCRLMAAVIDGDLFGYAKSLLNSGLRFYGSFFSSALEFDVYSV